MKRVYEGANAESRLDVLLRWSRQEKSGIDTRGGLGEGDIMRGRVPTRGSRRVQNTTNLRLLRVLKLGPRRFGGWAKPYRPTETTYLELHGLEGLPPDP